MQTLKRGMTGLSLAASLLMSTGCGLDAPPAPLYFPQPQGYAYQQALPVTRPAATGSQSATKPAAKPKTPAKSTNSPTQGKTPPKPSGSTQPKQPSDKISQIIGSLRRVWDSSHTLQAHIVTTDYDGTKYQVRTEADAEMAKPQRIWARVTAAAEQDTVGTEITWYGGDTVQVLTKVLGISTTVNLPVNDKRLTGIWEWSIADTSIPRMMETLLAPNAPVVYVGQARLGDQTIDLIELKTSSVPKANRERLGIDPQRALPVLREIYRGTELMARSQYQNLRPNAPVPHLGG